MSQPQSHTDPGAVALDSESIRSLLSAPARALLSQLEVLQQTDSTNTRLLEEAEAGAGSGSAVVAAEQTAGRGRQGRPWFSPPGGSLSLSVLWGIPDLRGMTGLSLGAGVAVARALQALGVSGVGLKWPNDVFVSGRKLAGILVEARDGARCVAVIGIGVNLAFPETTVVDQPFTDLKTVLGKPTPPNQLAGTLLNELLLLLSGFGTEGLQPILDEWSAYDVLRDHRVRVEQDGVPFFGLGRGVNTDGALLLETDRGVRSFGSGNLKVRVDDPAG